MSFARLLKRGFGKSWDVVTFFRSQVFLFFRKFKKEQHQLTSTTATDRYPDLFNEARRAAIHHGNDRLLILSFGCSSGEECFTMKSYFPSAIVIGVDINKSNLRKARAKNNFNDIKFLHSSPQTIAQHGKYDLIFCLSVLCRWEDTKDQENCERIYPFTKFSETVLMLTEELATGGLFIVYNSNFRFEDTSAFKSFELVSTPSVINSGFVHKFDSSNNRITEEHRHCIYRKIK